MAPVRRRGSLFDGSAPQQALVSAKIAGESVLLGTSGSGNSSRSAPGGGRDRSPAFVGLSLRSRTTLAAENLFRRKQLALYRERQVKPRRASDPRRLAPGLLTCCFAWREALTIVQPARLVRWHREVFQLFWR